MNSDSKRLLFVDDEPGIRKTMPLILRRHGFTVTVAATVTQAIQEIHKQEFEILLSDLNIENQQDGYLVVRAIREVNTNCVAIILTGHPGFDSALEGVRQGVDDYILKPARVDLLVALLEEKLAERRQNLASVASDCLLYEPPIERRKADQRLAASQSGTFNVQNDQNAQAKKSHEPASFPKVHIVAEIVEFPNDPGGQPNQNETVRWLTFADKMLNDEKLEIRIAS